MINDKKRDKSFLLKDQNIKIELNYKY